MNRLFIKTIVFMFLLFTTSVVTASNIYIYSNADIFDGKVFVEDIASIEDSNTDTVKKIQETVIPKSLIKNGYLDAQVLANYLKELGYNVRIFGNSVKINMITAKASADIANPIRDITSRIDIDEILVRVGAPVRVVLNKNQIQIGITGRALRSGRSGDDIPVRVRDKIIYCKVVGTNLVEKE